jgi:biotin carboxyl carrier protein
MAVPSPQISDTSGKFYRTTFNNGDTINEGQIFGYVFFMERVEQCATVTGTISSLTPDQTIVDSGDTLCNITPSVQSPISVLNPVVKQSIQG